MTTEEKAALIVRAMKGPEHLSGHRLMMMLTLYPSAQKLVGECAAECNLTSPAITRLSDGLEKKNLIKRARDKQDRRKVFLSLTKQGKSVIEKLLA